MRASIAPPESYGVVMTDSRVLTYSTTHVDLAREATAAGLIVTQLMPLKCGHGGEDFLIQLWQSDGTLWAEGSHEIAEDVRTHIRRYADR
jgi:hypothetical protein